MAVATTYAAPSVYRMIPSLHGLFADTLSALFAMVPVGDAIPAMQIANSHVKVGKDVAGARGGADVRRRVATWLRANKDGRHLLLMVLLDATESAEYAGAHKGAHGTATVSVDEDLTLRATFENVPDIAFMGQAVALVNNVCVSRLNDVLVHIDAPVRVRPLPEPIGGANSASFGARWETRLSSFFIEAVDASKRGGLREALQTGNHTSFARLSRDAHAFRAASGYADPRHILDAASLASNLQTNATARQVLAERFRITEEEAQQAIDLSLEGLAGGTDAPSDNMVASTLPSVRVQTKYASVLQIALTGATPHDAVRVAQALSGCGGGPQGAGGAASRSNRSTGARAKNVKTPNDISYLDSLLNDMEVQAKSSANSATNTASAANAASAATASSDLSKTVPRGLILDNLYRADPTLFAGTSYAKVCGQVDKRQPVVITPEERERIDADFPGSYGARAVAHGSSAATAERNLYICPPVWCPMSRVSMTLEQLKANGGQCPGGADETPMRNESKYFKGGARHIGFLDPAKHPAGMCLPCCFNKPNKRMATCGHASDAGEKAQSSDASSGAVASGAVASGAVASGAVASGAVASGAVASGAVASGATGYYVMHEGVVPLPSRGRLGALPFFFNAHAESLTHSASGIRRPRREELVRVGSSGAPTDPSLLYALADVFADGNVSTFFERARAVVSDPMRFLDLDRGRVAATLMRAGDARAILASDTRFTAFRKYVAGLHTNGFRDKGLDASMHRTRDKLLGIYDAEPANSRAEPDKDMTSLVRETRIHAAHERLLASLASNDMNVDERTLLALADALYEECIVVVVQKRDVNHTDDSDDDGGGWAIRLPSRLPALSDAFAVVLEVERGVFECLGVLGAPDTNKRRGVETRFATSKQPKATASSYPLLEVVRTELIKRFSSKTSTPKKTATLLRVTPFAESSFCVFSSDDSPIFGSSPKYEPHARHVVEDRVFLHPLEAEMARRDYTREEARRLVTLAVRSDLQALFAVSSMRSTGTRPPEKIPETRKQAKDIVKRLMPAKGYSEAVVAWVADHLLFAEEPLSLRRDVRVVDEGAAVFVGETSRQELLDMLRPSRTVTA
jgi:hypothetical protein